MLSLALMGRMQAMLDQRPLDELVYPRAQAVLAYLAIEQRRQFNRAELAALFWPDVCQRSGLGNLRYAIHRLRRALGDGVKGEPYILASSQVSFNPNSAHRIDTVAFSTGLARAAEFAHRGGPPTALAELATLAELYRGSFLEGASFDPATDWGHWIQSQRNRLARSACSLLSILTRAHESRGAFGPAIRFARQQAEIDSADEEVQRRIMRLLARSGQTDAALAHYDSFKSQLAHDFATAPTSDTARLAEQIRRMSRRGASTALTLPPCSDCPFILPNTQTEA